jgi:hypothetical protein
VHRTKGLSTIGNMTQVATDTAPEKIVIATDYSRIPGPRFEKEGKFSGARFRDDMLVGKYKTARSRGVKLHIDLDGTAGYGSSFLEEAFGGLARIFPQNEVQETLTFKSDEEIYLIEEIQRYIDKARQ